ncbi:hypothetical protein KVV02_005326 [Mortierella alpina]|uniref:Mediator of RNA polymerase II transcription subunit 17 n=1 Tax=Mortierella alpina TaxID=64518 RepID=A0A9P7ZWV2_MORAP|nr:hypothetical protein KVV02_005326 [Mortierella alpina]
MDSQHSDKRIKLFLERTIDRLPFDITQKAEEIYLPDGDPAEKLKRKIKAITDAAGDHYDQFTENVVSPEEQQAQEQLQPPQEPSGAEQTHAVTSDSHTHAESALIPATNAAAIAAANARVTSPQGIYIKLWHAQSEIGMALDALNILISSYQSISGSASAGASVAALSNPNAPPTALPPGSLKCEYVPRAVLPLSAQIANEKLALGGKKHHLRSAADILMQGAKKLKKVMADEDQFWAGALRLRKNNWCIVSAKVGAGPGQQQHQQHLFVHYGFRDVGSLYPERAYAELVRNQTISSDTVDTGRTKSIQLHFPNKSNKVVIMSLVQQGQPHSQGCRGSKLRSRHTLHCQLLEAQSTLFDGELFHELVNEARSMTNSVSIVNNEIFLPINDELELKIAYRSPTPEDLALSLPSSSAQQPFNAKAKCLEETADILRCVMQLFQHHRHRQNIKDRSDSFFKSSRPGGGRTAGSFGQIQQTLQQRPTNMLGMSLQALQYYTFSRRIREVLGRVTRNLRQSWWEPISVHSVDIKSPPPATESVSSSATTTGASRPNRTGSTLNYGMGSSISISMGSTAPAVRFVLRSHPAPCAVLQLVDRPSAPIMHVTQFEQHLEEELADRAIGRICEVVNSVEVWSELMPGLQRPKFEIDIEKRCVGVFEIPRRNGSASAKIVKVFLRLDMKAERVISITITSSQGGHSRTRRIYLEDQQLQGMQERQAIRGNSNSIHPHDAASMTGAPAISRPTAREQGWSMEGFRTWLKQDIISELENCTVTQPPVNVPFGEIICIEIVAFQHNDRPARNSPVRNDCIAHKYNTMGRKSGRSLNPADQYRNDNRKEQHKREIKKNKKDRQKVREIGSALKDTTTESELAEYEGLEKTGKLDKEGQKKLTELREKMAKIVGIKKAHGIKIKSKKVEPEAPVSVAESGRDPTRSIYYDPILNPYGAPPPGQPYLEYPPMPQIAPFGHDVPLGTTSEQPRGSDQESGSDSSSGNSQSDSDSDSDSNSSGSSSNDEDEDGDNFLPPLPEGLAPSKDDQLRYLEPTKPKLPVINPRPNHPQRPPMQGFPGASNPGVPMSPHGPPMGFQPPYGNMYTPGRPGMGHGPPPPMGYGPPPMHAGPGFGPPPPGYGPPGFGPPGGYGGPGGPGGPGMHAGFGPPGYHGQPSHGGPMHNSRPMRPSSQRPPPPPRYVKPVRTSEPQSDPMTGHLPMDEKEANKKRAAEELSAAAADASPSIASSGASAPQPASHPLPPKPGTSLSATAKPVVAGPTSISAEPQLRNLQRELVHLVPSTLMRKRVTQKGKIGKPVNAAPGVDEGEDDVSNRHPSSMQNASPTTPLLVAGTTEASGSQEDEDSEHSYLRETGLGLRLPRINLAPSVPSLLGPRKIVVNSAPDVPVPAPAPVDRAAKKKAEYDEFLQSLEGDGLL